MMTTAPGWYDDGHGALRWWDGAQWTEHVAVPDAEPADAADATGEGETAVLPPELSNPAAALAAGVPSAAGSPYGPYPPTASPGPAAPTAYPGGYPGAGYPGMAYPTDGGAFISATEPRKSKLWIVWLVLGVLALGVVVALAVVLPMLFLNASSGGGGSPQPGAGGSPQPGAGEYSAADEQAAIDAVVLYDQAYQNADCDAFMASTTEAFRDLIEVPDCETFIAGAADFSSTNLEYELTVTSVEDNGTSLSVFTTETYQSMFDDDGNQTEELEEYEDLWEYVVVPTGDGWAIDDAYLN